MSGITNGAQIQALIKGDPLTLGNLYQEILPNVIKYVRANSGTKIEAEEIFQEALYQIILKAKTKGITIKSSLESYVYITCRNLWLQEIRKNKKIILDQDLVEECEHEELDFSKLIIEDQWKLFEEKLECLSENCAELLKAHFKKVPYKTIVEQHNYANENTALQRIFKCKKALIKLIKSDPRFRDLID